VATHRGLFRSTDSGHTFEPVPLPASGPVRNVRDVAVAPNVPTFAEAGYSNFDASFYFGVAAPRGTPADIAAKFAAEAAKIVATPEFKAKFLTNLGFEPVTETPEQFANFLKGDRELAAQKVKISGAKLD
jgi:tripartite-type tricarboxylate transporter receptor subunit TctC